MTITTNTTDRKVLVKAIAEELGTSATYLRAPTYAYQIGDFTVDRDGNIIGEDFEALRDFLNRNGYAMDDADADLETAAEAQPAEGADPEEPAEAQPEDSEETDAAPAKEEAPVDSEAEPITQMDVSIPAHDVTVSQLKNLTHTLYARQTLINRMTQSDCLNIPEILIQRLADAEPESPEAFTDLLDDCRAMEGLTGFDFRDGKVSMTFPFDEAQPEKWTTYAGLLNRIYDAAVKATRVYPERVEPDEQNEKYLAHIWLQRLGYHGPDFKAERKILLGHLTGYCAFANGDKMQAHKEKYTAIRRERRLAEQEAAVMEVMTEEANTDE
jgi:hypothetical protein